MRRNDGNTQKSKATSASRKSNRGGKRPGAGRPKGAATRDVYPACCEALAAAMDGATGFQFAAAMMALGGDLDRTRQALGLSQATFAKRYGAALLDLGARLKLADAA